MKNISIISEDELKQMGILLEEGLKAIQDKFQKPYDTGEIKVLVEAATGREKMIIVHINNETDRKQNICKIEFRPKLNYTNYITKYNTESMIKEKIAEILNIDEDSF